MNVQTIFDGCAVEYFDDRIEEYSNMILQNMKDDQRLATYVKELHNYSMNLINNDQSLENFDVKLATILNNKLSENKEKLDLDSISILVYNI